MERLRHSLPQLMEVRAVTFSPPSPVVSEADEDSFSRLRPLYLVNRRPEIKILAARFKPATDSEFGDWQAVSLVPADPSNGTQNSSVTWILLGYVPVGVDLESQLRCQDQNEAVGIARAVRLFIPSRMRFGVAVL
jgi:hypothetical protein